MYFMSFFPAFTCLISCFHPLCLPWLFNVRFCTLFSSDLYFLDPALLFYFWSWIPPLFCFDWTALWFQHSVYDFVYDLDYPYWFSLLENRPRFWTLTVLGLPALHRSVPVRTLLVWPWLTSINKFHLTLVFAHGSWLPIPDTIRVNLTQKNRLSWMSNRETKQQTVYSI